VVQAVAAAAHEMRVLVLLGVTPWVGAETGLRRTRLLRGCSHPLCRPCRQEKGMG
jgi:hypothetical protein